jgi:hypothetical protein
MNGNDVDTTRPQVILPRFRFSLLALLLFVTLAAILCAWLFRPRYCVAVALFQASAIQPMLFGDEPPRFDAREYEVFQSSQIELLKSDFVLQAAVRDPAIAALPLLASKSDPVAWLAENLDVGFVEGSEILSIRSRGPESQADDLRQIVDAVAKAYLNDVVYSERQRLLTVRDVKAVAMDTLRSELESKITRIEEGQAESGDSSAAVKLNQVEVDVLLDLWRGLVRSLEVDDLNTRGAPDRVRQLQPAVVSPD